MPNAWRAKHAARLAGLAEFLRGVSPADPPEILDVCIAYSKYKRVLNREGYSRREANRAAWRVREAMCAYVAALERTLQR